MTDPNQQSNQPEFIEYRVNEIRRFSVTRYARGPNSSGSVEKGEYSSPELAYEVAYALAKDEHNRLGWPIGDMRIKYPEDPRHANARPVEAQLGAFVQGQDDKWAELNRQRFYEKQRFDEQASPGRQQPPAMRAKMQVTEVKRFPEPDAYDTTGEPASVVTQENLTLRAVGPKGSYPSDGSDEDNTFAKFTPQASLSISILNPALIGQYRIGDMFYIDFHPIPA